MYLFIRFGLAKILTRFTVHRGMFHSLPACLIAGELAFLISGHENPWQRYFNGGAVMLGFMSHLVLDEIWSLDFRGGRLRFKSSFGTAMKFWGDSMGPNCITYAGVVLLSFMSLEDPSVMNQLAPSDSTQQIADQPGDRIDEIAGTPRRRLLTMPWPEAIVTPSPARLTSWQLSPPALAYCAQARSALSIQIVTGPSFTSDTCMCRRNFPVATVRPRPRAAVTNCS